jgi:Uma2 family endonuclease
MSPVEQARATLEDLSRVQEKAELIDGRIVYLMATGHLPGVVGGRIYRSLADHVETLGVGEAYPDGVGFAVHELPSGRESFSPDAAYHRGPFPEDPMRFLPGAPAFAVEVRSEHDYGAAPEAEMAEKRADYFLAGTQVVWDVDPIRACVLVYRAAAPNQPTTYARGSVAEAEPAVPGWRVPVDWIFRPAVRNQP